MTKNNDLSMTELSHLSPGEKAIVVSLGAECVGDERRRLLDLGFVPGTEVEMVMVAPLGDPIAYMVRGTQIALRRIQAHMIQVRPTRKEQNNV